MRSCVTILLSSQPGLSSLHLFVSSVTMQQQNISVCLSRGAVVKNEPKAEPAQPPRQKVAEAGPSADDGKALM